MRFAPSVFAARADLPAESDVLHRARRELRPVRPLRLRAALRQQGHRVRLRGGLRGDAPHDAREDASHADRVSLQRCALYVRRC